MNSEPSITPWHEVVCAVWCVRHRGRHEKKRVMAGGVGGWGACLAIPDRFLLALAPRVPRGAPGEQPAQSGRCGACSDTRHDPVPHLVLLHHRIQLALPLLCDHGAGQRRRRRASAVACVSAMAVAAAGNSTAGGQARASKLSSEKHGPPVHRTAAQGQGSPCKAPEWPDIVVIETGRCAHVCPAPLRPNSRPLLCSCRARGSTPLPSPDVPPCSASEEWSCR